MVPTTVLSALLLLFCTATVTSQNCSNHNPCGSYGYCQDDVNGDANCTCKFWWKGAFCNEQSSSGIQVITLGVALAVLIVVFYALSIGCAIRRKKQKPKKEKPKVVQSDPNTPQLKHIALANVKTSTRLSSCLVAIAMLIVATLTMVVKWLLLQPIHNELVNKYNEEQPLFYERNEICSIIDLTNFNMLTFPVACLVVLIFILFSKRTSCLAGKLRGYIGPVIPMDFYIHVKRKFAMVVFVIIADELLFIVLDALIGNTSQDDGVIVVYLLRITQVLIIGLRYYPVLAAVYMDTVVALVCATLYAWLDLCISIVDQSLCQPDFYPSNDNFDDDNGTALTTLFGFYGTGPNLILIEILTDLPRYLCWAYIVVKLPMLLFTKIHKLIQRRQENRPSHLRLTREEKILLHSSAPHSVEMSYVRNLFRPVHERSATRFFLARMLPKFIYLWRDDFRFSSRVVSVYASVFLLLILLTIKACVLLMPGLDDLHTSVQTIVDSLTQIGGLPGAQRSFPVPKFPVTYILAILTAFVITLIQLLVMLANIRRNLLQVYRGDISEIPRRDKSSYLSYTTGNFHFAGYFIGYLVLGFVLIAFFAFVIYVCIDAFITFGSVRYLENVLQRIIPVLLLIFFKQYLNKLLARYVFLQHYGDVLAINNRRVLMIFLYFNFFLDSFLGLVSAIVRIIKSVLGGCIYMCRLDYSPLGRKLEALDAGFSAYCGFIHLEAVHRNPIMLVAASYLYGRMKAKQYIAKNAIAPMKDTTVRMRDYSSKASRRWHLAVFLLRYPSFKSLRKNALLEKENQREAILMVNTKRLSRTHEDYRRASLVSEIDLHEMWQKNTSQPFAPKTVKHF